MPHGALITPEYARMIYKVFTKFGKDSAWRLHHDIYHFEKKFVLFNTCEGR